LVRGLTRVLDIKDTPPGRERAGNYNPRGGFVPARHK